MRIFVFRSETRDNLRAFAGDMVGTRLPAKFGPWRLTNTVPRGGSLPHDVSRSNVERAIMREGFQLFRFKERETTA